MLWTNAFPYKPSRGVGELGQALLALRLLYARLQGQWTVYGISSGGMEATLDDAKRRFKETFEAAGELAASPNRTPPP